MLTYAEGEREGRGHFAEAHEHASRRRGVLLRAPQAGTHFTILNGTKVQTLTQLHVKQPEAGMSTGQAQHKQHKSNKASASSSSCKVRQGLVPGIR